VYIQAKLPQDEAYVLGDIGEEFKKVATRTLTTTPTKEKVLIWEYTFEDGTRETRRAFCDLIDRGEIIVHHMKNATGQWCLIARSRRKPAVKHLKSAYRGDRY
jgi:hypothetical protein